VIEPEETPPEETPPDETTPEETPSDEMPPEEIPSDGPSAGDDLTGSGDDSGSESETPDPGGCSLVR
jgi:hypothetical protein